MKKTMQRIGIAGLLFAGVTSLCGPLNPFRVFGPTEFSGAWKIVKQSGHENYGFVTELGWGFVAAGYTNKASAEAAMKEARWHHRHPPKPKPKTSLWETQ